MTEQESFSFQKRITRTGIGVVCTALHLAVCDLSAEERPGVILDKRIESTPDLPQSQKALPGNGGQYCAPVAASNGLAWLASNGYPSLMPAQQVDLAKELGSSTYMNTSLRNGTSVKDVGIGLGKYVVASGYEIRELTYQSWRSRNKILRKLPGHANPVRIAKALKQNSIVLLNIGFYKQRDDEYERLSGHWVTLVGAAKEDGTVLIVHDSAGRSPEGDHERVTTERLRTGTLVGQDEYLPTSAKGAWRLGGELKLRTKGGADTAILDGAILLRLK